MWRGEAIELVVGALAFSQNGTTRCGDLGDATTKEWRHETLVKTNRKGSNRADKV